MNLRTYMEVNKLRIADVARGIGVAHSVVSRIVHGHRLPSGRVMQALFAWSSGAITPADFNMPLDREAA